MNHVHEIQKEIEALMVWRGMAWKNCNKGFFGLTKGQSSQYHVLCLWMKGQFLAIRSFDDILCLSLPPEKRKNNKSTQNLLSIYATTHKIVLTTCVLLHDQCHNGRVYMECRVRKSGYYIVLYRPSPLLSLSFSLFLSIFIFFPSCFIYFFLFL